MEYSICLVHRWLRPRNRGAKLYAIVGSLSVYLHDILVRLPEQGDTSVHVDCMYTRQDDLCKFFVVPERYTYVSVEIVLSQGMHSLLLPWSVGIN